ncbi:MAG: hypothetical protein FWH21_01955 [Kiritimatiellaeota bacterium]|nr:hypothetical protein [Kiritimatiellota bacterium]
MTFPCRTFLLMLGAGFCQRSNGGLPAAVLNGRGPSRDDDVRQMAHWAGSQSHPQSQEQTLNVPRGSANIWVSTF